MNFMDSKIEQLQQIVMTQKPEKADAIVWLQGNEYDRGKKSLELYRGGFAPFVVVTGNNTRIVDIGTVRLDDMVAWLTAHDVPRDVIIIDDQSINTHDQSVCVLATARARDWKAILLVGSPHYQLRAFLTFLKQAQRIGWQGRIINQPVAIGWNAKPSGRSKTTEEAFHDEIAKLSKYKDHVATVAEGLRYLGL